MGRRDSLEAKRAYNRERYWRNREKILAQQRERYEANKEEILSSAQEYYQDNKEKIKARAAKYYQDNTEKVKAREALRRKDKKVALVTLLGGRCSRSNCTQTHPAALDFHHKDVSTKLFAIGDMITSTKQIREEDMIAEVMKCELLCKNCHAIEHCSWEI